MERLKISPDVRFVDRGEKIICINPNLPSWVVTNQLGRVMLSLFDGTHDMEEIIDIAVEGLGVERKESIEDFCNRIVQSGLLENAAPTPRKHRMVLSSVHLSLSESCNLNCSYCYARERKERKFGKVTLSEYRQLVDDLSEISDDIVYTLTGGEPLLNPDCFALAEYIKNKGQRVFLLSNGTLFNERNIEDIARLCDLVTLSVDGPNDKIHALTRGNNFDKVMNAVRLLEEHHVNHTVSMTVTKQNIGFVEEMAKKFGDRLNYAPYFPVSGNPSELAITGMEYYNALHAANGVRPLGYCESALDAAKQNQCHKCAIGDGEFSVSATGDVYPCQLLHVDEFYAGNIHETPIKDIYLNAASMKYCARLDVDSMQGCKDCPIKYVCGGSCRARAYYGCGDINSSTDFCRYEKEAFYDGMVDIYSKNVIR